MGKKQKKEAEYGYAAIVWLTAKVFLDRGFAAEVRCRGAGGAARDCPFGNDLAPDQARAFDAASAFAPTRFAVWLWWLAYGLGLVLGQTLGFIVADSVSLVARPDQESGTNFLLTGILLALLIYGLSGAIGGFVGGWSLPVVSRQPPAGQRQGAPGRVEG